MTVSAGVDCILIGFRDTACAVLSHWLHVGGNTLSLAEKLESDSVLAAGSLTLWNIPSDLPKHRVAQALTSTRARVLCVAPRALGAGFCLKNGAADALTRPWDVDEILARTERLLGRLEPADTITLGAVAVCLQSGKILGAAADAVVPADERCLRAAELRVLRYLSRTSERYVPIDEIQSRALEANGDGTAVRFHVKELRRKLGAGVIQTRRGFGYRLTLDRGADQNQGMHISRG